MSDGPEWFAPKRFGYGAGPPIAWQGWVLLIGYVAIAIVLSTVMVDRLPQFFAIFIPLTVAFLVICARTTRGGWRWRSGGDE